MGGGAHELHAAGVGLMVGLGALEAGQERVVDVDALARHLGGQIVGQHLHVAREHGELGVEVDWKISQIFASCAILVSLVTGRWWKGTPSKSRWA